MIFIFHYLQINLLAKDGIDVMLLSTNCTGKSEGNGNLERRPDPHNSLQDIILLLK